MEYSFTLYDLQFFLLLLVRILSFISTAPFFGARTTPRRVKILISVVISFLVFQTCKDVNVEYSGVMEYAIIVIKESVVGMLLGLITNICVQTIYFAGNFIDMDMGFAMATLFDPSTGVNISVTGNLYYYLIMAMFVATDMHQYLIRAIVDTYKVIPVGELVIRSGLLNNLIDFVASYFIIGFRIALPVFATILIINTVLGILAKVAPQMNMFAIGLQLKVLAGLLMLLAIAGLLPTISNIIFEYIKKMIVVTVEGMH